MQVNNEICKKEMPLSFREDLQAYRNIRNFDVEEYVFAKCHILEQYVKENNIKAVIVPMSGGIDSALVLALVYKSLSYEARFQDFKIIPCNLSCLDELVIQGVTNQNLSLELSQEYCKQLKLDLLSFDLTDIILNIEKTFQESFKYFNDEQLKQYFSDTKNWSEGQLVSYLRQALLYYCTSIYTDVGSKALIIGTNNKDEMSYIGFYGKAADGMVDIQLISDIHKSEVYTLAKYLNVPDNIINRKPNGDMYHNKTDEEFFGFSYDFLELYTFYKKNNSNIKELQFNEEEREYFTNNSIKIEELHKYNAHKYKVGSPAIHMDVINEEPLNVKYDTDKFVGLNTAYSNPFLKRLILKDDYKEMSYMISDSDMFQYQNLINEFYIDYINAQVNQHKSIITDVNGYAIKDNANFNTIGSIRSSIIDDYLSKILFDFLKKKISKYYVTDSQPEFNIKDQELWEFVGVSQYFRFITYAKGMYLMPHYDSTHIYDENHKTLQTLIISLTDTKCNTEFIDLELMDENDYKPEEKIYPKKDLEFSLPHTKGGITIFPHGFCHQVSPNKSDSFKRIIRTDLIYSKVF